jgi:hypothetical protein
MLDALRERALAIRASTKNTNSLKENPRRIRASRNEFLAFPVGLATHSSQKVLRRKLHLLTAQRHFDLVSI